MTVLDWLESPVPSPGLRQAISVLERTLARPLPDDRWTAAVRLLAILLEAERLGDRQMTGYLLSVKPKAFTYLAVVQPERQLEGSELVTKLKDVFSKRHRAVDIGVFAPALQEAMFR